MSEVKNDIEIFSAKPEDVMGIQEVFYNTWLNTYPNKEFNITLDDLRYRHRDIFSEITLEKRRKTLLEKSDDELYLVAKDEDKIVGVCYLEKDEKINQLRAIYILPDYQGRGIGTRFWNELQSFLDTAKDVVVDVVVYNKNAIEFYNKLGFADTGERFSEERFRMRNGAFMLEMRMIKRY
jgi:ribosomal protein S18 acetylase RimI-like enzyme